MKLIIKIVSVIVSILLIADITAGFYFYNFSVARTKKDFLSQDKALTQSVTVNANVTASESIQTKDDLINKGPFKEVSIVSDDGLKLIGYYHPAKVPSLKTAILAHGYSSQGMYMESFASIFYDMGYNVLMPDDRGHGKSQGDYIGFGWVDRKDYLKWIDFVINKVGQNSQIILYGVSMGGATVLMTSGEHLPQNVKAIISDCAYTSVKDELKYQLNRMYHLPSFPLLDTISILTRFKAGYSFEEASALDQVKKSKTPTLFIHGDADKFVPPYMVNELYNACSSEKELMIVPGAGHGMSYDTNPDGYQNKVQAFADKYVK